MFQGGSAQHPVVPPQQQNQPQIPQPNPRDNRHHARFSNSHVSARGPPTAEEIEAMNATRVTSQLLEYMQKTKFPYMKDVSSYEKLQKIGQGTFGEVFKARCKTTNKMVALKKILMENEKEGFPITALREVKMLQQLKHENITELIEVCSGKSSSQVKDRSTFYLVFAFAEHDLAGLLSDSKIRMSMVHIKTLMKHLLSGLDKLHRSGIMHRDMKAANVLLTKEGVLRLADFGLARPYFRGSAPGKLYTNRVVTLWYRPPELLLGDRKYTTKIDTWGAGCIMAELWTKTPIMQGDSEVKQLELIVNLCGSITPEVWPSVVDLPLYNKFELKLNQPRLLATRMREYIKDEKGLSMLDQLLCLDPSKRLTAEDCLNHTFFFSHPHPSENVRELVEGKQSHYEYIAGRGAHANRGRMHHHNQAQQRPQPRKSQAVVTGQYHDIVF